MPTTAARPRVSRLRRLLTARGRSLEITRSGWLFVGLTLAVGFAAINSGANLLHAIFGAQMALIIASGILSEGVVRRVRARRRMLGPVHAGAAAPLLVEIDNTDPRSDALSLSVEDDDRDPGDARGEPVFVVRLPAHGRVALPSSVTMPRRGLHPLPRAVVVTRFPFGLFVKRRELEAPATVTVYPEIRQRRPVAPSGEPGGDELGAGGRARTGDFFGLREYREGDDARRIYWPAYARLGRPVMREHEARGRTDVVRDLAPGRTGDPEFEARVSDVASLAVADLALGTRVGLRYAGSLLVEPDDAPGHRERLLEILARVGESD